MTAQDTRFATRFPSGNMSNTPAVSVANFAKSGNSKVDTYTYSKDGGVFNNSMLSDIGRAMVYGPETQDNIFSKYMTRPLARGNAEMTGVFKGVKSRVYDPLGPDSELFNANRPEMLNSVISKNVERTVDIEVNDAWLKQFVQSEEMIGDAQAAISAQLNASYLDDMYALCSQYFLSDTHTNNSKQMVVLDKKPSDSGFDDALIKELYNTTQRDFKWKSPDYNSAGYATKSDTVDIIMDKGIEYQAFRRLYSETFHPDYIKIQPELGFVDSVPGTVAGAPADAGDLLCVVADRRAFGIVPMPDAIQTDSFRIANRHSTAVFMTYQYGLGVRGMFNYKFIFAPKE